MKALALEPAGYAVLSHAQDTLHDVSQPLTALSLGLYLLEAAAGEEERRALLLSMQSECSRAVQGIQLLRGILHGVPHIEEQTKDALFSPDEMAHAGASA